MSAARTAQKEGTIHHLRSLTVACALLAAITACTTSPVSLEPGSTLPDTTTSLPESTTTSDAFLGCREASLQPATPGTDMEVVRLADGAATQVAVAVSAATFECARHVVVVPDDDRTLQAEGARLAAHVRGPLLLADSSVGSGSASYEIDRLAPETVWELGELGTTVPTFTELVTLDGTRADIIGEIDAIAGTGADVVPSFGEITEAGTGTSGWVWLVDHADTAVHIAAAVAAFNTDGLMVTVTGNDLRVNTEAGRTIHSSEAGARTVRTIGVDAEVEWQLPVIASGQELPGGGFLLFPDRRLVALYGNPTTDALGILGHQDADAAVEVARRYAEPYEADGVMVIPTFEIIATVAAASAGEDGNYSNEMPLDLIRPWIDVARREGLYVVLDLQSGRSHFLEQAMLYEEFLLEPHVGLALDPEWRLEPDQVHLVQVGSVRAAEVNEVSSWLAALVREHHLPQKLFLLHQFRFTMLPDRELIEAPPELAVVIQMDGQGTIPDKYATWGAVTRDWEEHPWDWGWKNFTREDIPGPIPPSEVLELTPVPVFVSYQ